MKLKLGWSQNMKRGKNLHETQVNMAGLDDTRYKNKYTEIKMVSRGRMVHCGKVGLMNRSSMHTDYMYLRYRLLHAL